MASSPEELQPEDIADFALPHSRVPTTEKLETSRLSSYCFNNTSEIYQPKQMDALQDLTPPKKADISRYISWYNKYPWITYV